MRHCRRYIVAGGLMLVLLTTSFCAAGVDASKSSTTAALPAGPVAAAQALVRTTAGIQLPCYPNSSNQWYLRSRGCPVTLAFQRKLRSSMRRDVDPICACQNYAIRNVFHLIFQRARLAVVAATLTFTYNTVYIVFVEVNRGTGWAITANYVTHI